MDIYYLVERELKRRKRSDKTIKTYNQCLKQFFEYCKKEPRRVTKWDVKKYLYKLCDDKKSASTMNVHLMAIKFALEEILNKRFFVKLPFSKVPKRLPVVLSQEQTKLILNSIINPKHKLLVSLMYSAGLRVSELVRLKIQDLDFKHRIAWVRGGKGNKDRPVILAQSIIEDVKQFIAQNNSSEEDYVFKGRKKSHYSTKSVSLIVKRALKKAKKEHSQESFPHSIHPHTFRHSFATHLIEQGTNLIAVQALLGHQSLETTSMYVHCATKTMITTTSPLDKL